MLVKYILMGKINFEETKKAENMAKDIMKQDKSL